MKGVNHELPAPLDSEYKTEAWGIPKDGEKHEPLWIARPKATGKLVNFETLYSGVCHSDLHTGLNHWGPCNFPFVGGHELLGKVVEVGSEVTKFKKGDIVGVGCFIDSCRGCENCEEGSEQYCLKGMTGTYNSAKVHGRTGGNQATFTAGGYSASHSVHEDYVIKIPDGADLERTAPLMCAGITMYSPLNYWGATKEKKMTVGIIGIGGLGTMGIKLAKILNNDVIAISQDKSKEKLALGKGADKYVAMTDPASIEACVGQCDLILNTVSAKHDLNVYIPLLKKGKGILCQLGGVGEPHPISQVVLMFNRFSIVGSLIGGIKETQECIDLCVKNNIYPDIKMCEAKDISSVWENLENGNSEAIRFVIDVKKSLENKDHCPK